MNEKSSIDDDLEEILEEREVSEEFYDEVFTSLRNEIESKQKDQTQSDSFPDVKVCCKVCGIKQKNSSLNYICKQCGVITCKKCRSCGFCLNCYVHLHEDARKTLKLTRILVITAPAILVFLNIYGILYYFSVILFMMIFFGGLYLYTRSLILKNPSKYIDPNWLSVLKTPYYESLRDSTNQDRYIDKSEIESLEKKKERRINNLKTWIEPDNSDEIPKKPLLYEENSNDFPDERIKEKIAPQREITYKFIDKSCPLCGETIQFADFCPECDKKFCPECGEETSPYSARCLCGFCYPDLEKEFKERFS